MENETGARMATKIKVGDTVECIRANGSPRFDDVCPVGQRRKVVLVSYETMWLEGSGQYVSANRFKIVEPPPAIDWTKPIQWEDKPAKFVGEIEGKYVVWRNNGVCAYNKDGTYEKGHYQWITNAPPPPLWPVKRWFVSWLDHSGKPQVSGQAHTEGQAKIFAARLETGGHKDVWIKEVTFG